jgi:hypothetical protein
MLDQHAGAVPQSGIFALGEAAHNYLELNAGDGVTPEELVRDLVATSRGEIRNAAPPGRCASDLRYAAVDGDFAGGHEAAVRRREKGGHRSDRTEGARNRKAHKL